ncbi:hypothetical protein JHW43_002618 [Diplocarpon mali]|nr:hypothetical protein JHW43_002618 [Diplocarpon mali]
MKFTQALFVFALSAVVNALSDNTECGDEFTYCTGPYCDCDGGNFPNWLNEKCKDEGWEQSTGPTGAYSGNVRISLHKPVLQSWREPRSCDTVPTCHVNGSAIDAEIWAAIEHLLRSTSAVSSSRAANFGPAGRRSPGPSPPRILRVGIGDGAMAGVLDSRHHVSSPAKSFHYSMPESSPLKSLHYSMPVREEILACEEGRPEDRAKRGLSAMPYGLVPREPNPLIPSHFTGWQSAPNMAMGSCPLIPLLTVAEMPPPLRASGSTQEDCQPRGTCDPNATSEQRPPLSLPERGRRDR